MDRIYTSGDFAGKVMKQKPYERNDEMSIEDSSDIINFI